MTAKELASMVDHTLLGQTATWQDIKALCDDAVAFGTASVCIPPCYVAQAAEYVQGKMPICTVIGFPNGNTTTGCKVFEAREAIANGATEIDMVINIGLLKAGRDDEVMEEIRQLKAAAGPLVLKVIIETCLLTDDEKIRMCRIVSQAGADFIKTSTGFSTGGATFEDVALFAKHVDPAVRIKASGGIATLDDARRFVALGASRLGTSRIVKLLKNEQSTQSY
ncbi:MAG: deoxyribose-phosphate aldolase [Clostridiales bacterium]|nr:deoxyribose-phosphate aldolase [Clostridiales bacterium]